MPDISYGPAVYNVTMVAGDTFKETFSFADGDGDALDLDGYQFSSQLRETAGGTVVASMTITTGTATVTRSLGTAVTAGLSGKYVHDFQWVTPDSDVRTLFAGSFTVVDEVTR
jgi:hypothetical protein